MGEKCAKGGESLPLYNGKMKNPDGEGYFCDGCIDYQDVECKADMDTRFMENSCYRPTPITIPMGITTDSMSDILTFVK